MFVISEFVAPQDFECDGTSREKSNHRKGKPKIPRPKGSFKKFNSERRLHGEGYIKNNTCNLVPPKTLGVRCSGNCEKMSKKCNTISDEDRKKIFDAFCGLPSIQLQREFICRHVETHPKKESRAGINSRREATNIYFLTIRRQRVKVCKKFFLETLEISEKVLRTAISKLSDVGIVEPDKRGKKKPPINNVSPNLVQLEDIKIEKHEKL